MYVLQNVASGVHSASCAKLQRCFFTQSVSFARPSNSTRTERLSTEISSSLHPSSSLASTRGTHAPKRRQVKRTEEERIECLRADLYVGKFEAYRVLCACCDKWIRLRPNSAYCSIPWDAHRKSCLAKIANELTSWNDHEESLVGPCDTSERSACSSHQYASMPRLAHPRLTLSSTTPHLMLSSPLYSASMISLGG
ncbi:hypothetical protein BDN70DRAFT_605429 [Pholiota conissans]|uniref:Uncharacterized protein n=1 Tax=Pholiota conissans TaxID=109636 RepID=A0A9P5YKR4_9AGAR|nr:hypothetical protein BDN70DRAFT_605429 [Pholiota conissans]